MQESQQEIRHASVDIIPEAENEADRIACFRASLELVPHGARYQVLGCFAGAVVANDEKYELLGLRGPGANLSLADRCSLDGNLVSILAIRRKIRHGDRVGSRK